MKQAGLKEALTERGLMVATVGRRRCPVVDGSSDVSVLME